MLPDWVFTLPWEIIRAKAQIFVLDPYIIAAIIMTESYGNACAIRYEENWKYSYEIKEFSQKIKSSYNTEKIGQKTSWGYMQVMGSVAREHDFLGWFPQLCLPETGIEYGVKHFNKFYKKHEDIYDAIASYNAGSPRKKTNGKYINQEYVNKVMSYYSELHSYGVN